ncbi:MAG: hypothetical protein HYT79_00940 [Elusimicrobia bacterium]|nr:hypothetical protein [Elusimicrobiota bacterium]
MKALLLLPVILICGGFLEANPLKEILERRYEECLGERNLSETTISTLLIDQEPTDSDLHLNIPNAHVNAFAGFPPDDLEELDCLVLDHIIVTAAACPLLSETNGPRLGNVVRQLKNGAFFASMVETLVPAVPHAFEGMGGILAHGIGGTYSPGANVIAVNNVFACLPAGWEAPVLAHEFVHAYVQSILGNHEPDINEEILSEIIAYRSVIEAGLTDLFHCRETGGSSLVQSLQRDACQKIRSYRRRQWRHFERWGTEYSDVKTDQQGKSVIDFYPESIHIAVNKTPANPCDRAVFYLKNALSDAVENRNLLNNFLLSVRSRRECLGLP